MSAVTVERDSPESTQKRMEFVLPPLPYTQDALDPFVSARTVAVHYEKHHRGYLEKLTKLIHGKPEEQKSLEQLVRTAEGEIYDNAAQAWNHAFYWNSLKPGGGGEPQGELRARIEDAFGSYGELEARLGEVATGHFGSGWAWLEVDSGGRLRVTATADAGNPLREGGTPLLAIDVWEHAYYLDYLNERERYVEAVIAHLLDWQFAARNLPRAASGTGPR